MNLFYGFYDRASIQEVPMYQRSNSLLCVDGGLVYGNAHVQLELSVVIQNLDFNKCSAAHISCGQMTILSKHRCSTRALV